MKRKGKTFGEAYKQGKRRRPGNEVLQKVPERIVAILTQLAWPRRDVLRLVRSRTRATALYAAHKLGDAQGIDTLARAMHDEMDARALTWLKQDIEAMVEAVLIGRRRDGNA